jgi:hypothetical protein
VVLLKIETLGIVSRIMGRSFTPNRRYQAMVKGRSAREIKARCSSILEDDEVILLFGASSSPSAAFDMVFAAMKNSDKAKAGRWLAVLRRDHPEEYQSLIPIKPSHVNNDTAQTEKEMLP